MDMQVFNSPEGQDIRVIDRDGDPWFVAADVCRALDIANPSDTLGRLDSDEHTLVSTEGIPGAKNPQIRIVSESGLYSLVLGSRKPEAKAFKRWVTHEVLPQIRRTGSYHGSQDIVERLVGLEDPHLLDLAAEGLRNIAKGKRMLARAFGGNVDSEAEHVDTVAESALRAWVVTAPEKTTTEEALAAAGLPNTRTNQMLAGRILHGNGYQRRRLWGGGDRIYVYTKDV